jgi:7-cyano-7-deazaguanine synthase in queuosine biosynthesis
MKTILYWSGGIDSTYILYDYLRKGITFETVYIKFNNNKLKGDIELSRRENIKKILVNYYHKDWNDKIIDYDNSSYTFHFVLPQALIWLESIFKVVDSYENNTCVFGYMRRDDFWHYKPDLLNLFKMLHALSHKKDTNIELKYPLEWKDKDDIINDIFVEDIKVWKKLFNQMWTCEGIDALNSRKHCGKCISCEKFIFSKKLLLNLSKKYKETKSIEIKEEAQIQVQVKEKDLLPIEINKGVDNL